MIHLNGSGSCVGITPLLGLLGDSQKMARRREREGGGEIILQRSVNIWTERPLFDVSPPRALKV